MILAELFLDIDFSRISKVGTGGVEFYEEDKAQLLDVNTELENKINELQIRLNVIADEVEKLSQPEPVSTQFDTSAFEKAIVENFYQTQAVSDQTAKFGIEKKTRKPLVINQEGYIFIGNYDPGSKKWSNQVLTGPNQKAIEEAPGELIINDPVYQVIGNMVLREQMPNNDKEYYKGSKKLGIVPKYSIIRLVDKPKGIDREYAVQWWVKVRIEK